MGQQSSTLPSRFRRIFLCLAAVILSSHGVAQTLATTVPVILPSALVYDGSGALYFAEAGRHLIRRVDLAGYITTVAGTGTQGFSGDSGLATAAELDSPQGLTVTATSLYIADTHNHRIRRITLTTGVITTVAGGLTAGFDGDSGLASAAHLNLPTALALDAAENLYFADSANHRIRKITLATGIMSTIAGDGTQGDAGDSGPAPSASIDSPRGLAVDAAGDVYLADTHNHRVRKITAATGIITNLAGTGAIGRTDKELALPHGITLGPDGSVSVADTANHRIVRFNTTTGATTTITGEGTQGFSGDNGPALQATLDSPTNVAISSTGQLTLADTGNQRVRQISAATIHTVAGLGATASGALTLTGPIILTYGTGQLVATLTSQTAATGSITFLDSYTSTTQLVPNTTTAATNAIATNAATLSTNTLSVGVHLLTATYSGDLTHSPAQSSALTLTIAQAPTLTTMIVSDGLNPVALTVVVASTTTGGPTGTLSLLEAAIPIGVATLSRASDAVFPIPTLGAGSHTLIASYGGDANFLPSRSAPATVTIGTVTPADFNLTATGNTAQTVSAGGTAVFSFVTQATGDLSSPITLSVTGLPPGATATFNPTLIPPGQTSNTFTLTLTSLKPAAKANEAQIPFYLGGLLLPILLTLTRRRTQRFALLSLSCFAAIYMTGCGARINTGAKLQSTSATYTVAITGTATSLLGTILTHSTNVTLTIQ
jgi:sugar lactone lactonase YvrE